MLDPNARVRETLEYFFEAFRRVGSAMGVVKVFRRENVLIPTRIRQGPHRDEMTWVPLTHNRAMYILHNPCYAGAFFFGRTRQRQRPDGGSLHVRLRRDEWIALIPNAHPGYIGWEEFEENQRRLCENSAATCARERKRMVRLLIEDVTLSRGTHIRVDIRFRGGSTKAVTLPLPSPAWLLRKTATNVIAEIDALLEHHTPRGHQSGEGKPFNPLMVWRLERDYGLRSRYDRLRAAGMLTLAEIAARLGVSADTVKVWRRCGLLKAHAYTDKPNHLFEPPGPDAPALRKKKGLSRILQDRKVNAEIAKEVQYEA